MNPYGRSAQEQREYERLRYPDDHVLRNKLDCRIQEELDEAERLIVAARLKDNLPASARRFDVAGLKAIHRHLFQDIYDWAGEFRRYTTGRSHVPFPPPEFLDSALDGLFRELRSENHLTDLDRGAFAVRAAHYVNEINTAHPFVEGNGRTQRVWLRQLAEQAGYSLVLAEREKAEWYQASAYGFHKGDEPMAELIARALAPLSR